MRDPERIASFLDVIGFHWQVKCPDWRFGQLMYNFFSEYGDPFYWEEDKFLNKFEEYMKKL